MNRTVTESFTDELFASDVAVNWPGTASPWKPSATCSYMDIETMTCFTSFFFFFC